MDTSWAPVSSKRANPSNSRSTSLNGCGGFFCSLITELEGRRGARYQRRSAYSSFGLTLPDGTSFNLGLTPVKGSGDSGNLGEDITDLFVAAAEAASAQGRGVLIAIDEIQYLNNVEFGALISAVHRTTQLNLPLVLVGAGLPMLPGLAGNSKSYSERLFAFPVIGKLENKDAREAIVMPASDFDVTFTKQALAKIIDVTEGYPFFIQEWAHEIWNHSAGPQIRETDVDAVRSRVISKLDGDFFHVRLDRLTPTEKKYMRAMAQLGPGPHRSGDIAAIYDAKVETVAPLRASLIRKGMIYSPAFGDTAFTVPLFHDFLKRSLPFKKAAQ